MERFKNTTVSRLQPGDRFYKLSDRNKTVLEMVQGEVKRTLYRTYGFWCKGPDGEIQAVMGNTKVVFLRHADEDTQSIAA